MMPRRARRMEPDGYPGWYPQLYLKMPNENAPLRMHRDDTDAQDGTRMWFATHPADIDEHRPIQHQTCLAPLSDQPGCFIGPSHRSCSRTMGQRKLSFELMPVQTSRGARCEPEIRLRWLLVASRSIFGAAGGAREWAMHASAVSKGTVGAWEAKGWQHQQVLMTYPEQPPDVSLALLAASGRQWTKARHAGHGMDTGLMGLTACPISLILKFLRHTTCTCGWCHSDAPWERWAFCFHFQGAFKCQQCSTVYHVPNRRLSDVTAFYAFNGHKEGETFLAGAMDEADHGIQCTCPPCTWRWLNAPLWEGCYRVGPTDEARAITHIAARMLLTAAIPVRLYMLKMLSWRDKAGTRLTMSCITTIKNPVGLQDGDHPLAHQCWCRICRGLSAPHTIHGHHLMQICDRCWLGIVAVHGRRDGSCNLDTLMEEVRRGALPLGKVGRGECSQCKQNATAITHSQHAEMTFCGRCLAPMHQGRATITCMYPGAMDIEIIYET